jgi:hypothetical protein
MTDFGDPADIISRTLVFKIPNKKRTIFRKDFKPHVGKVLQDCDVVAFGSVARNDTWHMTVSTKGARTRVLQAGNFYIEDQQVRVSCLGQEEFIARVHWCPFHVPMGVLAEELNKSALVISAKFERSPHSPWENAPTLVRSVLLRGDKERVPHLLEVGTGDFRSNVLVTITGRLPVCLKCQRTGHVRRLCETPQCRHCKQFGHYSEECERPTTAPAYASVVRPPQDLSDNDDSQDASQSLLPQQPTRPEPLNTEMESDGSQIPCGQKERPGAVVSQSDSQSQSILDSDYSPFLSKRKNIVKERPQKIQKVDVDVVSKNRFAALSDVDSNGLSADESDPDAGGLDDFHHPDDVPIPSKEDDGKSWGGEEECSKDDGSK